MWQKLGSYFFRGLVTLLPLLVTLWLLWFMYSFLDSILGNIIALFVGHPVPLLGFILIIGLIFLTGYLTAHLIGAKAFDLAESFILHIPVVKNIYSAAKQVNEVLFTHKGAEDFRRACIVEYPRKGVWSVGFVTSDAAAEIEAKAKEKMLNVFIVNTPTPATGFLIMVPAREVILLNMKTEDAFKYVISAGVLRPDALPQEVHAKKES